MTTEQQKVIARCKSMLKRAFPEMTGKFIFQLDSSKLGVEKGIKVGIFMPNLKLSLDRDLNTVDLRQ